MDAGGIQKSSSIHLEIGKDKAGAAQVRSWSEVVKLDINMPHTFIPVGKL